MSQRTHRDLENELRELEAPSVPGHLLHNLLDDLDVAVAHTASDEGREERAGGPGPDHPGESGRRPWWRSPALATAAAVLLTLALVSVRERVGEEGGPGGGEVPPVAGSLETRVAYRPDEPGLDSSQGEGSAQAVADTTEPSPPEKSMRTEKSMRAEARQKQLDELSPGPLAEEEDAAAPSHPETVTVTSPSPPLSRRDLTRGREDSARFGEQRADEQLEALGYVSGSRADRRVELERPGPRPVTRAAEPPPPDSPDRPSRRLWEVHSEGELPAAVTRALANTSFVESAVDPLSTFGLEVDTGSWGIARKSIASGSLPRPETVRVEEFLNAFEYPRSTDASAGPDAGDAFDLVMEAVIQNEDAGTAARRAWLRVGLSTPRLEGHERRPASLTFLVDTSGSMDRQGRLKLVRRSLDLLAEQLEPGDTVGIVAYSSTAEVVLEPTGDVDAIRAAVARLRPSGSTNLEHGMELAYQLAASRVRESEPGSVIHRVILCSDGVANVGLTDGTALLRSVARWAREGIELTTVGVGMGTYNDELLERLADRGDGRYAYVDDLAEARRLFVENLAGTLDTVAWDARVQVVFDSEWVTRYRLLGYENRAIPDRHFRDPDTDGGEIGVGHQVTALYEVELARSPETEGRGWWPWARDRGRGDMASMVEIDLVYRPAMGAEAVEQRASIGVDDLRWEWSEASPALRLAVVVGRFAEILRQVPNRAGELDELFVEAQNLVSDFPEDRRVVELAHLVGKARDLVTVP